MLELSVSQAQTQFTKLLNQVVLIVDKKSHTKKAVILPYEEYNRLLAGSIKKENLENGSFNQFIGLLDGEFTTTDEKYNEIIK